MKYRNYDESSEDDIVEDFDLLRRYVPHANDNPSCYECGGTTRRSGSCFTCEYCGETTGCG